MDIVKDVLIPIGIFAALGLLFGAILAIAQRFGAEDRARETLCTISFFLTALMMLISLYLMYCLNGGYWIYAVFSISAFSFIKKSLNSQKRRFREI